MTPSTTRIVTLRGRPEPGGSPTIDLFALEERPISALESGQLLVRNIVMSVDPSMRGRLDLGEKHYTTNFELGQPLDGSAIGEVVDRRGSEIAVGALVRHRMGWREFAVVDASTVTVINPEIAPAGAWLGVLGQTGFTAWVGLKRIGELHQGDTVFISAAAGAVGSAAGNFAKLLGAGRVVGSAGGAAKVRQLIDELGYDDAMDYRVESPWDGVQRMAPEGVDLYFDNVGGPHLVAALHNMTIGGRVALCGMISQFAEDGRGQDINNLIEAVLRRVTVRGFIVRDHEDMRPEFEKTVAGWLRNGDIDAIQTVTDGIEHAVDAFLGMLKGANIGKALVRLDADWQI
ncbi:MAG: NADP-dependent oxidoreductase [Actinomycetota bacterium]|jgi:NADPH-dependent curcumin reductase CurA|nr:NADP-dependent oxidoreductase [Actinomycetota bacterium]MDA3011225.1 NADP-dependent oxidoreductase [Actinomycetota bacterium]MDA3024355.1 NADP-dependent oxidoreductase [Actinomycetota bacterium]